MLPSELFLHFVLFKSSCFNKNSLIFASKSLTYSRAYSALSLVGDALSQFLMAKYRLATDVMALKKGVYFDITPKTLVAVLTALGAVLHAKLAK